MTTENELTIASILIVDGDIISRHAIADYLRHCGYSVIEAAKAEEAFVALLEPTLSIDVILCDVSTLGSQIGFELANWVRSKRPELEVKLVGGAEMAAQTAAELCESGPDLARPYEPSAVIDYIKRLRASRLPANQPGSLASIDKPSQAN
jgi:CheY-like chemotaxis protein